MNKTNFFRFVMIPLAIFAVAMKIKDAFVFQENAPLFVLTDLRTCLYNLNNNFYIFNGKLKPKKCKEIKGEPILNLKDSNILYQGNTITGIQGQDRESGRWYQVDTTDERYVKVVPYEK